MRERWRAARPLSRLILLLIVALGLAPGTWVRAPSQGELIDNRQLLTFTRIPLQRLDLGEPTLAGAWELHSPNWHFHGYSALVPLGDGSLLAVSDSGRMMHFRPPGAGRTEVEFDFFADRGTDEKRLADVEALARDPATGRLWAAYEMRNLIVRLDANLLPTRQVRPPAMRDWRSNSGPEAMVRLADGRFIVLAEASPRRFASDFPALLFPADPVTGAVPTAFRFAAPDGFRPVDMAQLPDGRVLILLRKIDWGLPPGFASRLVVADPSEIAAGAPWRGRSVAEIAGQPLAENYEGLAVEPGPDGSLILWLISDDNRSRFQRTLLLKLAWRANEKARGSLRAP